MRIHLCRVVKGSLQLCVYCVRGRAAGRVCWTVIAIEISSCIGPTHLFFANLDNRTIHLDLDEMYRCLCYSDIKLFLCLSIFMATECALCAQSACIGFSKKINSLTLLSASFDLIVLVDGTCT